ncbi:MAG: transposase [Nitrospinota bacterium]
MTHYTSIRADSGLLIIDTMALNNFLSFYDVYRDCLTGQIRKRKTVSDLLPVFKRLRVCYPINRRLYIIMDNLSSHYHSKLQQYLRENNMESVWTPTYASWLNAIESHFGPLK